MSKRFWFAATFATLLPAFFLLLLITEARAGRENLEENVAAGAPGAVTVTGQIGGRLNDYAVQDGYLYALTGPSLSVLALPASSSQGRDEAMTVDEMRRVGYTLLQTYARSIVVTGSLAYLADLQGLTVVDIEDSAAPQVINALAVAGESFHAVVDGRFLYLVTRPNTSLDAGVISVYDLSLPRQPILVATAPIDDFAPLRLQVDGSRLYVTGARTEGDLDASGWLRIFDISQPAVPAPLGTYFYRRSPFREFSVQNQTAYLLPQYGPLQIVDLSAPLTPTLVTTYTHSSTFSSFAISGTTLYVNENINTGTERGGVIVVDMTDPQDPKTVGRIGNGLCDDFQLDGHRLFFECWQEGLWMADVSDPHQPIPMGRYRFLSSGATYLAASGETLYAAGPGINQTWLLDASDPTDVLVADTYTTSVDHVAAMAAADQRLYLLGFQDNRRAIEVIDVALPMKPRFQSLYRYAGSHLEDLAIDGTFLYVTFAEQRGTGHPAGLRIVDVSDPQAPIERGVLEVGGNGFIGTVAAEGGTAFFVENQHRQVATIPEEEHFVHVADVSDPDAPLLQATYAAAGRVWSLAVGDEVLYISFSDYSHDACRTGVEAVDVSNPAAPHQLGVICFDYGEARLLLMGDYLFAGSGNEGVRVLDVTLPSFLGLLDEVPQIMGASDVVKTGENVFVADWVDGVYSLDFRPPLTQAIVDKSTEIDASADVSYQIPDAAFAGPITWTHRTLALGASNKLADLLFAGPAFEVQAVDQSGAWVQPGAAYTVSVTYHEATLPSLLQESSLALYRWDGTGWVREPTSQLDTEAKQVTATPSQTGIWALLGKMFRLHLPIIS